VLEVLGCGLKLVDMHDVLQEQVQISIWCDFKSSRTIEMSN
jgi:hypothetical protein